MEEFLEKLESRKTVRRRAKSRWYASIGETNRQRPSTSSSPAMLPLSLACQNLPNFYSSAHNICVSISQYDNALT